MPTIRIPITAGNIYHLYNHANSNQNLFRNDANYLYFLKKYAFYLSEYVDTYAYCLMPNHFHLLIRVKNEGSDPSKGSDPFDASKVTNAIKNWIVSYTNAYNKMYDCKGNLFVQRIRRKQVDSVDYFRNLVNYIHMNPVLHNFVSDPFDWKYSSYSCFFSQKTTQIDKSTVLNCFDDLENLKYCHDLRKIEKFAIDAELLY